uniref:Uncharacterized protein n=1 Tax=Anguilla anguilla TaxID=7936 RepID=A0A0E9WBE8_ANGAN
MVPSTHTQTDGRTHTRTHARTLNELVVTVLWLWLPLSSLPLVS